MLQPRAVCVPNPGQYFFTFQEMVLNPHPAVCKTCTDPHPFLCYIFVYEFWVRILHLVRSTDIRVRRFYGSYAVQCSKILVMRSMTSLCFPMKDSVTLLAKALFELIRLYKDLQYSNNESILNIYSMKKTRLNGLWDQKVLV